MAGHINRHYDSKDDERSMRRLVRKTLNIICVEQQKNSW